MALKSNHCSLSKQPSDIYIFFLFLSVRITKLWDLLFLESYLRTNRKCKFLAIRTSSHRGSTAIVTVHRLQIGHESRYDFVDLTPKMKLIWWDKILLIRTWGKTEGKQKTLSLSETIYKYTLSWRSSLKMESMFMIYLAVKINYAYPRTDQFSLIKEAYSYIGFTWPS